MSSLNMVVLIGRLGADPEVRTFANGDMVANLSIATSESWTDKASGEKRERTEWHKVVLATSGLARVAKEYLRKGALVSVTGKLVTRKWQDRDGADRYVTEVIVGPRGSMQMLGAAPGIRGNQEGSPAVGGGTARPPADAPPPDDLDDDVPF